MFTITNNQIEIFKQQTEKEFIEKTKCWMKKYLIDDSQKIENKELDEIIKKAFFLSDKMNISTEKGIQRIIYFMLKLGLSQNSEFEDNELALLKCSSNEEIRLDFLGKLLFKQMNPR